MSICRNTGSAKRLEGNVYVITFFVSKEEWSVDEKTGIFKQMRDAESWLERTAAGYGKKLRFVNGVHGLFEPFNVDIVPDYDAGGVSENIAMKYLALAGCPYRGYSDWVRRNSGCEQSLVFVIANSKGRGYATPIGSNVSVDNPEGAILYHSTGSPLYAGDIIHEILHLFGAEDLYAVSDKMKEIDRLVEEKFPHEVMHRTHFPLKELMISPLTAWLVGLSDKKEPWFDSFLLS